MVLLLSFSIGVQWPLLQSLAWLNMLVTFSASEGVAQAIVKTFDGKHPCKLCKLVREGKEAEKKNDAPNPIQKKLDPMLTGTTEIRLRPLPFPGHIQWHARFSNRTEAPPGEPPDLA